ncbi:MAG: 4-hydroxy-tetrahydrodipicolinate synthase [Acidobacteriota bacterium]|nr:4-hydroxy-tetrahydrodipicolinate synthase [Acidobacteriota bacterium]
MTTPAVPQLSSPSKNLSSSFSGVFTALVTPFRDDGALDEEGLRRLVRRQIAGGVAGLVPCGTTGEAVTLDPEEHERVVAITVEEARAAARRVKVIAGCGSNDTKKGQDLAARCRRAGADALLVVTPYYNKPTPHGLVAHFKAVADGGSLPVVLYNVPGRTGLNMQPETVLELAQDPRIVGVKEASGSLDQACEILRARPAGFAVLSGEDSLAVPMIACGAEGVIAVVSNAAPSLYVETIAAALAGNRTRAAQLQARIFPLMRANFRESNPIPVKWALERLGLIGGAMRLPLVPLSPAHHKPMEEALTAAGLLDAAGKPVEGAVA